MYSILLSAGSILPVPEVISTGNSEILDSKFKSDLGDRFGALGRCEVGGQNPTGWINSRLIKV